MIKMRSRAVGIAALTATLAAGMIGAQIGLAQDATPMAGMSAEGHPNHVHEGTCANINPQPEYPLAPLIFPAEAAGAMATPVAGSYAPPTTFGTTTIETTIADLLKTPHAINVHKSAADLATYYACGDIVGTPDKDGNLVIGLRPQNDSGYTGVAWLSPNGNETTVVVFISDQSQ